MIFLILKFPEVRSYNELLKFTEWRKFLATVNTGEEQFINGTNIQVDYSHGLDGTGYQFANAKFFEYYNSCFSNNSYNVQEFDTA